jgi:hypothetical protein
MTRPTKPQAMMPGLEIWTVYNDQTSDHPGQFVARLFINDMPTTVAILAPDLNTIRSRLRNKGFTRLPRQEADDPVIVEVWL